MPAEKKKIISASRRTDIPGCYYDWLQQVLKAGEVSIANPRFREKVYRIDLHPEKVHSLVLWSKDFRNVLARPGHLDNYNLYFQYTINNYPACLEPNVPDYLQTMRVLEGLLKKYRPEQFNIRFDPVIVQKHGQGSEAKPGEERLKAFERLCLDLGALGMNRCRITTSYLALYPHVKRRMSEPGLEPVALRDKQIIDLFEQLAAIGKKSGFALYSCASPLLETARGLRKGACIDGQLLEEIFGGKVSKAKDTGQRKSCGCHRSSDIGDYLKKCRFHCVYCYGR